MVESHGLIPFWSTKNVFFFNKLYSCMTILPSKTKECSACKTLNFMWGLMKFSYSSVVYSSTLQIQLLLASQYKPCILLGRIITYYPGCINQDSGIDAWILHSHFFFSPIFSQFFFFHARCTGINARILHSCMSQQKPIFLF